MEGDHQYELRSRSRSRSETPSLSRISRESSERLLSLRRSSRDRSITPAEQPSRSTSQSARKDKNMDTIAEQREETPKQAKVFESTSKSTVKKVERRSERQKGKKQILTNGQSDETNSARNESVVKTFSTSDYSSEDTENENGPKPKTAYEINKQAGEWWNVFPKTDYTYAETSQFRYELAPGILAIPNMSRRSIHSNENSSFDVTKLSTNQSTNTSLSSKGNSRNWLSASSFHDDIISINGVPQVVPHNRDMSMSQFTVEQYYERSEYRRSLNNEDVHSTSFFKFMSGLNPLSNKNTNTYSETYYSDSRSQKSASWYRRLISLLFSWIYTILYMLERIWNSTSNQLYLILANVLLFDTWLLSLASPLRKRVANRRKKVLFLALLPILLWTGLNYTPTLMKNKIVPDVMDVQSDTIGNQVIESLLRRVQILENSNAAQNEKLQGQLLKLKSDCVTPEELNRVKLEFQSLHELLHQTRSEEKKSEVQLTSKEIEHRMVDLLQGYVTKEEWSKIILTMASKNDVNKILESKKDCPECVTTEGVDVRAVVREMLKIYDADKTGRVDYALESAGGQIISTRCTQNYDLKTRAFKIMGWTLFYEGNNPRMVIQGHPIQPGLCWAFQDFPGYLLIKTRSLIYVTGFTLEHVPKSILPNGDMGSAPRKFNVWGLKNENDNDRVMFGEYVFENSDESLQYFPVQNASITEPYNFIELQIHSNHGRLEYTCLYRFRIHGNLA